MTDQEQAIADVIQTGREINAFRRQIAVLADERADQLIRLRDEFGMTLEKMSAAVGLTKSRCAKIIKRRDFDPARRPVTRPGPAEPAGQGPAGVSS